MTFRRVGDERSDVERWVVGRMALAAAALVRARVAFVDLLRSAWWRVWPRRERIAVALLLAASMDDWVSHALGAPTPLDLAFKEWGAERSAVLMVVLAIAVALVLRLVPEPRPAGHEEGYLK